MTLLGTHVTLLSCAAALMTATAWAQDAAPPAAAPPAAAPPAEPAPAAPAPATPPAPAAEGTAPAAPAAPAPAPTGPAGWFRIDSDINDIQLWAGATHALADGIGLATDVYLNTGSFAGRLGEFDIGPAFTVGPFTATPMIGYQIDWGNKKSNSIVPQFYFTGGPDPLYMEFWFQNYENEAFTKGASNWIYMRLFADYKLSQYIGIGPEIEPWILLNQSSGVKSFTIGGNVMFFSYGNNNTLQLFVGYDAQKDGRLGPDQNRGLGGRFSFVHNW